jgi:hypothetical protein
MAESVLELGRPLISPESTVGTVNVGAEPALVAAVSFLASRGLGAFVKLDGEALLDALVLGLAAVGSIADTRLVIANDDDDGDGLHSIDVVRGDVVAEVVVAEVVVAEVVVAEVVVAEVVIAEVVVAEVVVAEVVIAEVVVAEVVVAEVAAGVKVDNVAGLVDGVEVPFVAVVAPIIAPVVLIVVLEVVVAVVVLEVAAAKALLRFSASFASSSLRSFCFCASFCFQSPPPPEAAALDVADGDDEAEVLLSVFEVAVGCVA